MYPLELNNKQKLKEIDVNSYNNENMLTTPVNDPSHALRTTSQFFLASSLTRQKLVLCNHFTLNN